MLFPLLRIPYLTNYIVRDPIGGNREVKKAVEAYWADKISADELTKVAADVKKTSWASIKSHGVDYIPRSD
jgi:5-methyltetrahydropteroyltriglutamate--homocysteine methyltransferase